MRPIYLKKRFILDGDRVELLWRCCRSFAAPMSDYSLRWFARADWGSFGAGLDASGPKCSYLSYFYCIGSSSLAYRVGEPSFRGLGFF